MEWLGDVPEHWQWSQTRHLFDIVNGGTPTSSEKSYWDGDIEWFTPDDLGRNHSMRISGSRRKITQDGIQNSSARMSPKGAIILSTRAPIGHLAVIDVAAATNQGCRTLVPIFKANSCFFYYSLLASRDVLQSLGKGSTFMELTPDDLGSHPVPLPSLSEQQAIAGFLDRETARVDALVEKKQQLIERLAEYRTALITQTVTKGLPPDVAAAEGFNPAPSLKPSGVEWLGDVPEHWEVKRAKYASKIIMGQSPPSDAYNDEQVEQAFLQGNAEFGALHPKPKWYCDAAIKVVAAGTILLSVRAPVGELNVADKNYGIGRGLCGLQTISKYLNRQFAWWALHTARQELEHQAVGSTYDAVSVAEVACLSLPLPPLSEQRAIAEFLDRETERIDALSARVETAIERLQEYRTALITAAVTGKIDVRGFVGVETADIGTVAK
ncbi:MAG: restriction endonuclease subunit S [bacterium]|nr:restriction endonuclease subunit S [bacterium]